MKTDECGCDLEVGFLCERHGSRWFRVEVTDSKGQIVAIESEMLCGRDIGDEERETVINAIRNLQGFIGDDDGMMMQSIANIRDSVLHQRHQLAEVPCDSDFINAVLGIIDDNSPKQGEQTA